MTTNDIQTENRTVAVQIAREVSESGGRAYYVGGCVRDALLKIDSKDIDIEVHGISPDKLLGILSHFGGALSHGSSFGIFGLSHHAIDIALPRRELSVGCGHRDFLITSDPFIGTEKAALRRDFTVNALMQDILSGQILDYCGGIEDLHRKILRLVNEKTFAEDPLRVLRAAQLAARFGFQVDEKTVAFCRTMNLSALSPERVFAELEKALLKSRTPSVFFSVLQEMQQLGTWFPELADLQNVEQNPVYHPEGDVWQHTMGVIDGSAGLRSQADEPLNFMLSALSHDLGKPMTTTKEGDRIRSIGHEKAGIFPAGQMIARLTRNKRTITYVTNMVELHMMPNRLLSDGASQKAFNRLFERSVCPSDLLLLAASDRIGQRKPADDTLSSLTERLAAYEELLRRDGVSGRDLIALGFTPGEGFAKALAYARHLQLSGVEKPSVLRQTASFLNRYLSEKKPSD